MKAITASIVFLIGTLFAVSYAQTKSTKRVQVRGTVLDADGFPVHKGYVFVDSLNTGFRTNKKGQYKLRIPPGSDLISIFSEEHGIQSAVYLGDEQVDITFPSNTQSITENELAALGYVFDKDVFRNNAKNNYSEYPDIFQIIREKFTGLTFVGNSIYVRGFIGGDQTPLFIVDGNYVDDISFINPDELKSIELLKGEDAALYGARGAPGVFIITLK